MGVGSQFLYLINHTRVQGNLVDACLFNVHMQEGNVLFNDALNTFYLRLYGITDIW